MSQFHGEQACARRRVEQQEQQAWGGLVGALQHELTVLTQHPMQRVWTEEVAGREALRGGWATQSFGCAVQHLQSIEPLCRTSAEADLVQQQAALLDRSARELLQQWEAVEREGVLRARRSGHAVLCREQLRVEACGEALAVCADVAQQERRARGRLYAEMERQASVVECLEFVELERQVRAGLMHAALSGAQGLWVEAAQQALGADEAAARRGVADREAAENWALCFAEVRAEEEAERRALARRVRRSMSGLAGPLALLHVEASEERARAFPGAAAGAAWARLCTLFDVEVIAVHLRDVAADEADARKALGLLQQHAALELRLEDARQWEERGRVVVSDAQEQRRMAVAELWDREDVAGRERAARAGLRHADLQQQEVLHRRGQTACYEAALLLHSEGHARLRLWAEGERQQRAFHAGVALTEWHRLQLLALCGAEAQQRLDCAREHVRTWAVWERAAVEGDEAARRRAVDHWWARSLAHHRAIAQGLAVHAAEDVERARCCAAEAGARDAICGAVAGDRAALERERVLAAAMWDKGQICRSQRAAWAQMCAPLVRDLEGMCRQGLQVEERRGRGCTALQRVEAAEARARCCVEVAALQPLAEAALWKGHAGLALGLRGREADARAALRWESLTSEEVAARRAIVRTWAEAAGPLHIGLWGGRLRHEHALGAGAVAEEWAASLGVSHAAWTAVALTLLVHDETRVRQHRFAEWRGGLRWIQRLAHDVEVPEMVRRADITAAAEHGHARCALVMECGVEACARRGIQRAQAHAARALLLECAAEQQLLEVVRDEAACGGPLLLRLLLMQEQAARHEVQRGCRRWWWEARGERYCADLVVDEMRERGALQSAAQQRAIGLQEQFGRQSVVLQCSRAAQTLAVTTDVLVLLLHEERQRQELHNKERRRRRDFERADVRRRPRLGPHAVRDTERVARAALQHHEVALRAAVLQEFVVGCEGWARKLLCRRQGAERRDLVAMAGRALAHRPGARPASCTRARAADSRPRTYRKPAPKPAWDPTPHTRESALGAHRAVAAAMECSRGCSRRSLHSRTASPRSAAVPSPKRAMAASMVGTVASWGRALSEAAPEPALGPVANREPGVRPALRLSESLPPTLLRSEGAARSPRGPPAAPPADPDAALTVSHIETIRALRHTGRDGTAAAGAAAPAASPTASPPAAAESGAGAVEDRTPSGDWGVSHRDLELAVDYAFSAVLSAPDPLQSPAPSRSPSTAGAATESSASSLGPALHTAPDFVLPPQPHPGTPPASPGGRTCDAVRTGAASDGGDADAPWHVRTVDGPQEGLSADPAPGPAVAASETPCCSSGSDHGADPASHGRQARAPGQSSGGPLVDGSRMTSSVTKSPPARATSSEGVRGKHRASQGHGAVGDRVDRRVRHHLKPAMEGLPLTSRSRAHVAEMIGHALQHAAREAARAPGACGAAVAKPRPKTAKRRPPLWTPDVSDAMLQGVAEQRARRAAHRTS